MYISAHLLPGLEQDYDDGQADGECTENSRCGEHEVTRGQIQLHTPAKQNINIYLQLIYIAIYVAVDPHKLMGQIC